MNPGEKLSILIPVYNAEETIASLCELLMQRLTAMVNLEIVLVNDGSSDNSGDICRDLFEKYKGVITYIELSKNFGEHNALMAGFKHVTGDYCLTMDDDNQNPPEETVKLLNEIRKGFDVVYASYDSKKDSWFRNMGSKLHNKMASIVLKKPATLYLSSFKIVNKFIIDEIAKYDGQDPYIDGIILRSTDRISSVAIVHQKRMHGSSGYTIGKLISLWGRMVLNFSLTPIRVIGFLGTLVSIISFIYGIYMAFFVEPLGVLTEHQIQMTTLMFLIGLILLCLSLIGEYIGKIYFSLNKEPQFVVRNILRRK